MVAKSKKTSKSKSFPSSFIEMSIYEAPKPTFTEDKAKMVLELSKDKGIERMMGRDLKCQAEIFLNGVDAGKKGKK